MKQKRNSSIPCPWCGAASPRTFRFCPSCGRPLAKADLRRCPSCGTLAANDARFCLSCGTGLTDQQSPPSHEIQESLRRLLPAQYVQKLMAARGSVSGERRIVTILFSDVKGSTAMAERLDPEEVLDIMNGAFEILIRPITHYEGTLARLMGDAVMALFGAPIAHEDDPERACRAALDIIHGAQQYARRLEKERGVKGFNVRVGLNTGLVVVAEVGTDLRVEYTAMGDAVNLAARMESSAEPGCILITDATYKLVKDTFDTECVGDISVKGKSAPVRTHRLLGIADARRDMPGMTSGIQGFVGRSNDLRKLQEKLEAVQHGRGGALAVVGEAGIGKSRLIQEARTRSFRTGSWIEWRAPAYEQGKSYGAAQMILRSLLKLDANVDPASASNALRSTVARLGGDRENEIVPFLSLLVGGNSREVAGPDLCEGDAAGLQQRIHHAYGLLIRLLAATEPIVLVAEDMHWFDRSSVDLLEAILPLSHDAPILFFLAYRPSGGPRSALQAKSLRQEERHVPVISVAPLTKRESGLLVNSLSGAHALPAHLRKDILSKTDGNPLFIEEVVRQVQERGGTLLTVPDTIRGALMARLDALSPQEQQTLQMASVLGRSFQKNALVETMKDLLPPASLDLCLTELTRREVIQSESCRSTPGPANPDTTFAFKHNLTHQVVHDSLLLSQRRLLHQRAGEAIESLHMNQPVEYALTLAEHFEAAGDSARAMRYFIIAGERAQELNAHMEALEHFKRAEGHAQNFTPEHADIRRIHEGLADAYVLSAHYHLAVEQYAQAITQTLDGSAKAILYRKRGEALEKSARYDEAIASLEESMKSLKKEGDLAESARVFTALARVYCRRRQHNDAVEVGLVAFDLMTQIGDEPGLAAACGTLGVAYCASGNFDKGIAFHERALAIWERRSDRYGMATTLNNLGWAWHQSGDCPRAEELYRKSITLAEKLGLRHVLASACDNLSQVLAQQGKQREAASYLKKAVTILADIESSVGERTAELWMQSAIS